MTAHVAQAVIHKTNGIIVRGQVLAVQQKEDKLKKTTKDLQAARDQVRTSFLGMVHPVLHMSCFHGPAGVS
jgi:hypothetical protein